MSITLHTSANGVQTNTEPAIAIKMAQKAKSQQEIVGQMALKLIDTASIDNIAPPQGNSGQNINIKI